MSKPPVSGASARLNRSAVQVGETYSIKGDAQRIKEIEDTIQELMEKKLRQAEMQAKLIIQEATETAKQQAGAIITQAQQEGHRQLNELLEKRDELRESAYQDGYDTGFHQGHRDATEKIELETENLLAVAHAVANHAVQVELEVLKNFQNDAHRLVEEVTKRIVGDLVVARPDVMMAMIEQAIESLYLTSKVKVVVSSDLLEEIRNFSRHTKQCLEALNRYEWIGDPKLALTEMYVLSSEGSFCISPSHQVEQLLSPLKNHYPLETVTPTASQYVAPVQPELVYLAPEQSYFDVLNEPEQQTVSIESVNQELLSFQSTDMEMSYLNEQDFSSGLVDATELTGQLDLAQADALHLQQPMNEVVHDIPEVERTPQYQAWEPQEFSEQHLSEQALERTSVDNNEPQLVNFMDILPDLETVVLKDDSELDL